MPKVQLTDSATVVLNHATLCSGHGTVYDPRWIAAFLTAPSAGRAANRASKK
eukprot:COSAG05_NODE_23142_length_260_cov_0.627329_1_plen_51_part_10